MKKNISILRRKKNEASGYIEEFEYNMKSDEDTVASALFDIAARIAVEGKNPLVWEHSCLQIKCGACAMVICGKPQLACSAKLKDLPDKVTIEPLRKFPVIEDLLVDRSVMRERLKNMQVYHEKDAADSGDESTYQSMKCLQCGICLEICPNYYGEGNYAGMSGMSAMAQILSKAPDKTGTRTKQLKKNYYKNVYEGCGKSLACRDVCPAGIPMDDLLSRMNAAAVWGRSKSLL